MSTIDASFACGSGLPEEGLVSVSPLRTNAPHNFGSVRGATWTGLAGETGRGRVVHSGLFRMTDGSEEWEKLQRGLPEAPALRALAVHPQKPEIVYAGTQSGPYRSADHGKHWEKVNLPDHGLPVWSI